MYRNLYLFTCPGGHFLINARVDDNGEDAEKQATKIEAYLKKKGLIRPHSGRSRLFQLISEW